MCRFLFIQKISTSFYFHSLYHYYSKEPNSVSLRYMFALGTDLHRIWFGGRTDLQRTYNGPTIMA